MKNLIKYNLFRVLLAGSTLLAPKAALAQIDLPEEIRPEFLPDIGKDGTAEEKIYAVVGDTLIVAMQVIGGLAIIMIIVAGIRYVIARGEEDEVTKAKTTLMWTIGGLILLFLVLAIINFVVKLTLVTNEA